jgi:hypothetical protein
MRHFTRGLPLGMGLIVTYPERYERENVGKEYIMDIL